MSEKTVRVCDVCGRVFKDVEMVQVQVKSGGLSDFDRGIDLCPTHLKRLLGFVERGISPLKGKA